MPLVYLGDRESSFRKALAHGLRQRGAGVVTFSSGVELYSRALEDHPDLIVLDADLEEMNGFQLFGRLLRHGEPLPRVVFVTEYTNRGIAQDIVERGALDYLSKGLPLDEILAAIASRLDGLAPAAGVDAAGSEVEEAPQSVPEPAKPRPAWLTQRPAGYSVARRSGGRPAIGAVPPSIGAERMAPTGPPPASLPPDEAIRAAASDAPEPITEAPDPNIIEVVGAAKPTRIVHITDLPLRERPDPAGRAALSRVQSRERGLARSRRGLGAGSAGVARRAGQAFRLIGSRIGIAREEISGVARESLPSMSRGLSRSPSRSMGRVRTSAAALMDGFMLGTRKAAALVMAFLRLVVAACAGAAMTVVAATRRGAEFLGTATRRGADRLVVATGRSVRQLVVATRQGAHRLASRTRGMAALVASRTREVGSLAAGRTRRIGAGSAAALRAAGGRTRQTAAISNGEALRASRALAERSRAIAAAATLRGKTLAAQSARAARRAREELGRVAARSSTGARDLAGRTAGASSKRARDLAGRAAARSLAGSRAAYVAVARSAGAGQAALRERTASWPRALVEHRVRVAGVAALVVIGLVMLDLLPDFRGKQVVIHTDGSMPSDVPGALGGRLDRGRVAALGGADRRALIGSAIRPEASGTSDLEPAPSPASPRSSKTLASAPAGGRPQPKSTKGRAKGATVTARASRSGESPDLSAQPATLVYETQSAQPAAVSGEASSTGRRDGTQTRPAQPAGEQLPFGPLGNRNEPVWRGTVAGTAPSKPGVLDADRDGVQDVQPPLLLTRVYPSVPRGFEYLAPGKVTLLEIRVGTNGRATEVGVKRSSGYPSLDAAAIDAVSGYRWRPALGASGAQVRWIQLGITFAGRDAAS